MGENGKMETTLMEKKMIYSPARGWLPHSGLHFYSPDVKVVIQQSWHALGFLLGTISFDNHMGTSLLVPPQRFSRMMLGDPFPYETLT